MTDIVFGSLKNHPVCYVLRTVDHKRTYNGITVDLKKRLRQHCGEITGGANATRGRTWEYIGVVTSYDPRFTYDVGLSLEWHIRHPKSPNLFRGPKGRLRSMFAALDHPKFNNMVFQVWLHREYVSLPFSSTRLNPRYVLQNHTRGLVK